MAELDFDHFDNRRSQDRSTQLTALFNVAGAACSIALVAGLGVWGYNLAMRDVNGVPVIRALAGPMRVMPEAPGGDIASHQGLAVNAVAAVGSASSMPDQVLLAPPPVDLASEDAPGLGGADPATALPQGAEVGTSAISPGTLEAPAPPSASDRAVALALADALAEGVTPFTDLAPETLAPETLAPETLAPDAPAELADPVLAPARSPRPMPRPAAGSSAETAAASSAAPAEIDPATLAVGTRLVQLGAFDDDAGARAEWARLQIKLGDLLAGKSLVVQAAQSGGRTFYRLRAHGGVEGEEDARRFCAALVAQDTPCIPALHK